NLGVAGHGEETLADVIEAHDQELSFRLELPGLGHKGIEWPIGELAGIGEHALNVLAWAARGHTAVVELRDFELRGKHRAEARIVGAARHAAVDLARRPPGCGGDCECDCGKRRRARQENRLAGARGRHGPGLLGLWPERTLS